MDKSHTSSRNKWSITENIYDTPNSTEPNYKPNSSYQSPKRSKPANNNCNKNYYCNGCKVTFTNIFKNTSSFIRKSLVDMSS